MSDPTTPFEVEQEMIDLNRRIMEAPKIIREHHDQVRELKLAYKKAWAIAYRNAEGTISDRKAEADLAAYDLEEKLADAEVAYGYVKNLLDALKSKQRGLQSISSLMKASMFSPQGGI